MEGTSNTESTAAADTATDKVEAVAEAVVLHPAHRILDEATEELNRLGSYAVTVMQKYLDNIRATL